MVTKIEPDLRKTDDIVYKVLKVALTGERVSFLVPANTSYHILARVRTKISRQRASLRNRGKKPQIFTLQNSVHPETHDGKRFDCITLWIEKSVAHKMSEILDDLLAKEQA